MVVTQVGRCFRSYAWLLRAPCLPLPAQASMLPYTLLSLQNPIGGSSGQIPGEHEPKQEAFRAKA